jgi:hypothetical protein
MASMHHNGRYRLSSRMAERNSDKPQEQGRTGWGSRRSKKHSIVSPMCPRRFRDSRLPSSFLTLETMVERSLFRTVVLSTYNALQAAEGCLSTSEVL